MLRFTYLFTLLILCEGFSLQAQVIRDIGERARRIGAGSMGGGGTTDSLRRRDRNEDSITIWYRYLDSAGQYKLDSSVNDFTRRFPIPATHIYLGNTGNPTRSLLFEPRREPGFDPGFHAYDAYKWRMEQVRFFNTTRPYSEINYLLGSRIEQIIELVHTQNVNPDWNVAFRYRLINSTGFYNNQTTNHNNYLVNSWLQSRNRRYNNYFVFLRNKLFSAENGGMVDTANFLENPVYKDRFNIPTRIGGISSFSGNFFAGQSRVRTGNFQEEFNLLMRQQYDFGKKDSIVTDSTVVPLFYPRLRVEHTVEYKSNKYEFHDYLADSAYYQKFYDTTIAASADTFRLKDSWRELINDVSIYQFPDPRNLQQFIRLGAFYQHINGQFGPRSSRFYNLAGHIEYRNKTRNQLWDVEIYGRLFFAGYNAADYRAYISLQRLLGPKLGSIHLGFENLSRKPSFVFDDRSMFHLADRPSDFNKENITRLFGAYTLPRIGVRLAADYYVLSNYSYITNFYELRQEKSLFNVLVVAIQKTFKLGKRWRWHADVWLQQAIGNSPLNLIPFYTRHRVGYEGNLGFRNLDIAFGTEIRYRPPYKADDYSPVISQFFIQDKTTIRNKLPDISAYLHFRIRPFKAFIRAENLNTARNFDGFNFTNNNLVAPGYALPGLQIRVGIYWSFIN